MTQRDLNQGRRIGVAGCRDNTADLLQWLTGKGYQVNHLLTVPPEDANTKYSISGYVDLEPLATDLGVETYQVEDYLLKNDSGRDFDAIAAMDLDLLIVLGWQKILPAWALNLFKIGAVGMHGSSKPLPFGRGHSVLNWSAVEGRDEFIANLFFYLPRVDAGPIVGKHGFDINDHDTCETLHFKYRLAMMRILERELPRVLTGDSSGEIQSTEGATYYPKRTPSDGLVNWNAPVRDVYNLIRGVTDPYPGAFSYLNGEKVMIWRANPFDTRLTWSAKPGRIVEVFHNGKFVVQTRDYGLIVHDYEGATIGREHIGKRFESA